MKDLSQSAFSQPSRKFHSLVGKPRKVKYIVVSSGWNREPNAELIHWWKDDIKVWERHGNTTDPSQPWVVVTTQGHSNLYLRDLLTAWVSRKTLTDRITDRRCQLRQPTRRTAEEASWGHRLARWGAPAALCIYSQEEKGLGDFNFRSFVWIITTWQTQNCLAYNKQQGLFEKNSSSYKYLTIVKVTEAELRSKQYVTHTHMYI